MILAEISFAGKIGFNIKDPDAKQRILEELQGAYGFKVIQRHFDRFDAKTTPARLRQNPHLVAVRTNGNPYLLFLTRVNFVNQCIFIDKKIQQGYALPRMILSRFAFDDSLFERGTLLDGEMVLDRNGNWLFLISDLVGADGRRLAEVNLVKRIATVYEMLEHKFRPDPFDVCHMQVKRYFTCDQLESVFMDFVPKLDQAHYSCRGLYFKPLFLKFRDILLNFDDSLIKKVQRIKFGFVASEDDLSNLSNPHPVAEDCEVDAAGGLLPATDSKPSSFLFYVRKTGMNDVYMLSEAAGNSTTMAVVSSLKTSKMLRALFQNRNVSDRVLMRCEPAPPPFSSEGAPRYVPIEPVAS